MGTLVYGAIASADGYVVDAAGSFAWAAPDAEVHGFVNDLERDTVMCLYGRRMFEVMSFWEDVPDLASEPPEMRDYASLWSKASKIVFSTTLDDVATRRTRLVGTFDREAVAGLVRDAPGPVSIGGPTLAARALEAGIVDEIYVLRMPVVVGGGTPVFPPGVRLDLALRDSRAFGSGATYARYAVRKATG